jgi:hypothetical protein
LAQTNRPNGTALLRRPMPRNAAHTLARRGTARLSVATTSQSATAARPTRSATIVSAGRSPTAIPTKKNEPPHSSESRSSMIHSKAPMDVLIRDDGGGVSGRGIGVPSEVALSADATEPVL